MSKASDAKEAKEEAKQDAKDQAAQDAADAQAAADEEALGPRGAGTGPGGSAP